MDRDATAGGLPSSPSEATLPETSASGAIVDVSSGPIIAGIGASAGGIEALHAFFESLPENLGIAFVVVVHLSPERRSALAAVLATRTSMPVEQVMGTVPLVANRVYVVPPDRRLEITHSSVSAVPFDEPRGRRAPIDLFFRSLAEHHGESFAIVLSGGGSDGAVGVKAIKEAGGLVLVQDPAEAGHDSMPRAAIATQVADLVLPVRDLARRLAELTRAKRRIRDLIDPSLPGLLAPDGETAFGGILAHLHGRTGHDFSQYKRGTVLRRLGRRLQVQRKDTLGDYLAFLHQHPDEVHALFADLLISVTTFFRDPEAWQALAEQVIPRLFDENPAHAKIRAWVPGCATGEEAYSLAMLLLEEAHRRNRWPGIQIFASDLDPGALAAGREGRYPQTIAADVSEERLQRFFRTDGEQYVVSKEVRECVVFATHSLLRDPPFPRLDIVSCRNLLIYLDRRLQQDVFGVFHYALRPGRYLFLGAAETGEGAHFRTVDRERHIYRAREVPGLSDEGTPLPEPLHATPRFRGPALPNVARAPTPLIAPAAAVHRRLLEELGPPSILVDHEGNAVHLSETAGQFLEPPGGPLIRDIARLVRRELRAELRGALLRAFERDESTTTPFIPVRSDGRMQRISLLVRPRTGEDGERMALVVFVEGTAEAPSSAGSGAATAGSVQQLQDELRLTLERLGSTREQFESSTEALRAANAELQSISEEYRSAAEELQTNKEELQSANEELETVNGELTSRLQEVSRAHSDLENLMAATEIGTLFLDRTLRIARFTPPVAELFNITEGDRGRSINDFTHRLDYTALQQDMRRVLKWLRPVERESRSDAGRWYLVRLRPYQSREDRVDGVVVTFVDVTAQRTAEDALQESETRYRLLVEGGGA